MKCPYKYRDTEDFSEAIKDKFYFYWQDDAGQLVMDQKHNYFQAQG